MTGSLSRTVKRSTISIDGKNKSHLHSIISSQDHISLSPIKDSDISRNNTVKSNMDHNEKSPTNYEAPILPKGSPFISDHKYEKKMFDSILNSDDASYRRKDMRNQVRTPRKIKVPK